MYMYSEQLCKVLLNMCILLYTATTGSVRGVLYYVNSNGHLQDVLTRAPHPPFIVLLEPEYFTE